MTELTFAGPSGVLILSAYAVLMLLIGWWAGRGQGGGGRTARGYYTAGGGLGMVTLFFTLYATQYSGNSVVGYAPQAYRSGFLWWHSVPFMIAIIAVYLLFAPRLYVLAKQQRFVTPTDFVRHRFGSTRLCLLTAVVMLWGLGNYVLEQLVAMGHGIAGLTGETVPYEVGVLVFVVVMLTYSWMGGMRAVAMTDVMQGIALLVGVAVLLIGALYLAGGGLGSLTTYLTETAPEKVGVPEGSDAVNWLAMIVMIGFGAAVYPHAIQRVYAARTERTLKRSLAWMAWMPLVTTGVVFVVGLAGLQLFPGLDTERSEQLVGMIANEVAGVNLFFYLMMILLFGGVVAAIVSTADSAILSFSSIVSSDIYGRHIAPDAPESRKVLVGKLAGVAAVAVLLLLAWNPPGTLLSIFVLKFELIVQLAPVFILGLYWKRMAAGPTFWGMLSGAVVAGAATLLGFGPFYGVPAGLVGLAVNVAICVIGSLMVGRSAVSDDDGDRTAATRA
ncbi:sodium:solute symporter family protein [Pseudonocardia nematodicida]|uniref:Sodium:solute symporter family protein n=1 Tax=Pseudonocardia nematodicida TaxID=1206997 RepID=A0ABV1KCX4_9PSEU